MSLSVVQHLLGSRIAALARACRAMLRREAAPGDPQGTERRLSARRPVDLAATIELGGRSGAARVCNLSAGGALLTSSLSAEPGAQGRLLVDGLDVALPCELRRLGPGGALHLAFQLDLREAVALGAALPRLVPEPGPEA